MKNSLPTLDRYLLRQLIPPFSIALTTMLIALLLERLLILFNHLANSGSSIATFVTLLTDLLPHYMGLAVPAALCIAVFLTIHRMSEHNEIDALCAGHISLLRITVPYMKVGLILGVLSVFLYGYIQPVARYDYRAGFYFARHTGWAPHLQSGMFASTSGHTMITADRVDHGGSRLLRVFIRDVKKDGTVQIITAPKGLLTIAEQTEATQLDLWNGHIMSSKHPDTLGNDVTVTHFDHITRLIERAHKKTSFRSRGDDERELTILELAHALRHGAPGIPYKALRSELDFRLARAIAIPFIPLLSVALAVGRKRKKSAFRQIALAVILVGFDETLLFGHSLAAEGASPVWLSIWVPEIIFCTACILVLLSRSYPAWYRPSKRAHTDKHP
ncbi:LptF/LptG family permease [Saccharibacter floricola]|uniref:Transporter YjgP/YjgQ n=1 Tax=Saccharibacter floricola DSM 15669 TaxID=1123227 RepID=A0ABQ0NWP6_9PROT|nr:LptF/LptG family permease [Saccharibacter floricola]GBQ04896.1 transporter YjgP/YjgQ [Saccharibacter floricola DSM 15669]